MNPAHSAKASRQRIAMLPGKALLVLLASHLAPTALAQNPGQSHNVADTRASATHKPPVAQRQRMRIDPPAPLPPPTPATHAKARPSKIQPLQAPVLKASTSACPGQAMSKEQAQTQGAVCAPSASNAGTSPPLGHERRRSQP